MPPPDELAQMFDEEPMLTTFAAGRRFKVNSKTIERHLGGTRWDAERLLERGNAVKGTANARLLCPTTPCARCSAMGQELDQDGVCGWCLEEIAQKLNQLKDNPRAKLRTWDLNYLTQRITA